MTVPKSGGKILVAGSANADFVVRSGHIPGPGETVLGGDLAIIPGGKGANQAVAASHAGGAATEMLVALGRDASADLVERSLTNAGVRLHVVRSERGTGAALITVSDAGENAITVAPGANSSLSPEHLPDLRSFGWLVLQLETPLATVTAYAQAARAAGVRSLLNVAPAQGLPAELLSAIDVLVMNEEELAFLVGRDGSIVDRLACLHVPVAIATLGARGCCALADGTVMIQPAFRVVAVDTTAAGDTFCGVLAAALAQGETLVDAMQSASAAAALATTRLGAQLSIPSRADVDRLLAEPRNDSQARADLAMFCGLPAHCA